MDITTYWAAFAAKKKGEGNENIPKYFTHQSQQSVGLEFCLVYSIVSSATLCILPWSLFLLSWHLYLAQQR